MSSQNTIVSPPKDGISSLTFSTNSNLLLVGSWDTTVRLYDAAANVQRSMYHHKASVLDCCFADNTRAFSGGLDRSVTMYEFNTGTQLSLGTHDNAIKCMEFAADLNLLFSGSWDSTVKTWDCRAASHLCSTTILPNKCLSMTKTDTKLIVATADRHILIYDFRNMDEPEQRRVSSLAHQTRCVKAFPDGRGFAMSSIEGRVAIEYVDTSSDVQSMKYAFKCHRSADGTTAFPVNTMAFHPTHGTFATGGCDGKINVWDPYHKRRLKQFHKYPTSIASLAFNYDGSLLAVASSYTFEGGDIE
eukprot:TRINITY_DN1010_c1_g2_i2.p2 TRINITY_DN1010_c1_g2~~TRINITY_DN1010_c1_g2_i2.p2  ORF type:complete len:302 (+),score=53.79 TRINITY_DN1010_c1_g2_i2:1310-2215(+)